MKTPTTILGLILAAGATAFAQQPAETAQAANCGTCTLTLSGGNTYVGKAVISGGALQHSAGGTNACTIQASPAAAAMAHTDSAKGGADGKIEYTVAPGEAGKLGEPITLTLSSAAALLPNNGAYLGVSHSPVPREMAGQLPIPPNTGLLVDVVVENSPAAKAGLQVGDVLAKLDDQILIHPDQFAVLVAGHKEGDSVKLNYVRKGQATETTAVLAKREANAPCGEVQVLSSAGNPMAGCEPGKPIRTFIGRIEGGPGAGTLTIKGGPAPAVTAEGTAVAQPSPANHDNAELRKELEQLRATLDALQQRLK